VDPFFAANSTATNSHTHTPSGRRTVALARTYVRTVRTYVRGWKQATDIYSSYSSYLASLYDRSMHRLDIADMHSHPSTNKQCNFAAQSKPSLRDFMRTAMIKKRKKLMPFLHEHACMHALLLRKCNTHTHTHTHLFVGQSVTNNDAWLVNRIIAASSSGQQQQHSEPNDGSSWMAVYSTSLLLLRTWDA